MSNLYKILGSLVLVVFVASCSNSDDGGSGGNKTGSVEFLHYVQGGSTFTMESEDNDRFLGSVDALSFSNQSLSLKPQTWDLKVIDEKVVEDGADDEIILDGVTFKVERGKQKVIAFIGEITKDTTDVELVELSLAEDVDWDSQNDVNEDGFEDNKAQYINFSHINRDLGELDIYLVTSNNAEKPLAALDPMVTLDFKETSEDFRLDENITNYYLRVALASDPDVEVYNSGKQSLKDYFEQTIIIVPYAGTLESGSVMSAFYYGDAQDVQWDDSDTKGQVRVVNAMADAISGDFDFDINPTPVDIDDPVDANLDYLGVSDYYLLSTEDQATYNVEPLYDGSSAFFGGTGGNVNISDGSSTTLFFYGRVADSPRAIPVVESDDAPSSKGNIRVTYLAYKEDPEDRLPYNVHIKAPGDLLGTQSVAGTFEYGQSFEEANIDLGRYEVWVTSDDNGTTIAGPENIDLFGGENVHYFLHEFAGGGTPFGLTRLFGAPSLSQTNIELDPASGNVSTGETVEVRVVVEDIQGNRLVNGGNTVEVFVTGDATGAGVATEDLSLPGTYTVDVTNATAETVDITVEVDGELIDATESITFN